MILVYLLPLMRTDACVPTYVPSDIMLRPRSMCSLAFVMLPSAIKKTLLLQITRDVAANNKRLKNRL